MLFNSYEFLFLFLPITWLGFEMLRRYGLRRLASLWLVVASGVFYASWNPRILLILIASILVNFAIGRALADGAAAHGRGRRDLLILGLAFNLGLLGYFKYANFFADNVAAAFGWDYVMARIVLPIGISFFTFQKVAFLIDSCYGKAGRVDFLEFCLFVMFFPQLIAGPIVHDSEVMPQFARTTREPAMARLAVGLTFLVVGLLKKVGIADTVAIHANSLFDGVAQGHQPALIESWAGTLSYAFQIYFDFSGYSDMAIGLGWMFGIRLPVNFASPYKATSITEFWQRWHITLSRFLKAYLYLPLGGNRRGRARHYLNLFATMLLGGLWHGAAWTFVLWGALHGGLLVIHRLWRGKDRTPALRIPPWLARPLTFVCIILAWVPFRAPDTGAAGAIYRGMFGLGGIALSGSTPPPLQAIVWLALLLGAVWFFPSTHQWMGRMSPGLPTDGYPATSIASPPRWLAWRPGIAYGLALAAALSVCVVKLNDISPFIYFQF